jgi:predicted acyl esterase
MKNRIHLFVIIFQLVFLSICTKAFKNETIVVPMRDGIKLATDLYFPEGSNGPWPLILIRTPNYKEGYDRYGNYYSSHGYAVAIQDVRGQNASEGEFEIWMFDKDDGYDVIEWLAGMGDPTINSGNNFLFCLYDKKGNIR